MLTTQSALITMFKAPSPNPVTLDVRISTDEFEGDTIQPMTLLKGSNQVWLSFKEALSIQGLAHRRAKYLMQGSLFTHP